MFPRAMSFASSGHPHASVICLHFSMYSGNIISPSVSTWYCVAATSLLRSLWVCIAPPPVRDVSPISCDHRMKFLPCPKYFVCVHPTTDKCIDKQTPGRPWSLQDLCIKSTPSFSILGNVREVFRPLSNLRLVLSRELPW